MIGKKACSQDCKLLFNGLLPSSHCNRTLTFKMGTWPLVTLATFPSLLIQVAGRWQEVSCGLSLWPLRRYQLRVFDFLHPSYCALPGTWMCWLELLMPSWTIRRKLCAKVGRAVNGKEWRAHRTDAMPTWTIFGRLLHRRAPDFFSHCYFGGLFLITNLI